MQTNLISGKAVLFRNAPDCDGLMDYASLCETWLAALRDLYGKGSVSDRLYWACQEDKIITDEEYCELHDYACPTEDYEENEARTFWFEGESGPCVCGSYSCDGLCDSYAEYRKNQKAERYYYAHLASNGEDFIECSDPDCKCHCGLLNGLDPTNHEGMTGLYVEGYNPFSFEGFMAGETVEHVLYLKDAQEQVSGGEDEIPF